MAIHPERFVKAKRFDTNHFELNDADDKVRVRIDAGSAVGDAVAAVAGSVAALSLDAFE